MLEADSRASLGENLRDNTAGSITKIGMKQFAVTESIVGNLLARYDVPCNA